MKKLFIAATAVCAFSFFMKADSTNLTTESEAYGAITCCWSVMNHCRGMDTIYVNYRNDFTGLPCVGIGGGVE